MAKQFRAASVYLGSLKVGQIESGTYDHESGDEDMISTEGWEGASDGADTVKLEFGTITPVKGHDAALKQVILGKKYARYAVFVDGALEQFEGRMKSRSYTWDAKSGACKGKFMVTGGKPKVT